MSLKRNRTYLIESFEEQWTCPITSMPMVEPVSTLDGHSYEKKDIEQWLKKQKTSPKTGLGLSSQNLIPNIVLKSVISKFQNQLKYEFEKICTQNSQMNEKLEKFEEKAREIVKQKNKIQNDYKEIKNKYAELLNNSKKVADSLLEYKKEAQTLRGQIQGLKEENKSLKIDIKSINSLRSENKMLKQDSQKLKKESEFYHQSLVQQKIEWINFKKKTQQQNLESTKQRDELKTTLKNQINKYNLLMAQTDQNQKLKKDYDQTILRYNSALKQIENLGKEIEKVNNEKQIAGQTIQKQVKKNIKLQAQYDKIKAETINITNELNDANSQLKKLYLQNQKLKNDYSESLAKLIQKQARSSKKHIPMLQKPQKINEEKMDEEKPSIQSVNTETISQSKLQNSNLFSSSTSNSIQGISKIEQYIRSRSWKSSGASDRLNESLSKMKSALTGINSVTKFISQNGSSMLNKIKQNTDSLKNLFSTGSVGLKPQEVIFRSYQLQVQQKISLSSQVKPQASIRLTYEPVFQGTDLFYSLVPDLDDQKILKSQEQAQKIRHILPFSDYLMSNPVLYDEQKGEIDHSGYKIDIEEFLKHDWTSLKTLKLNDSQLDDKGFQLLTNQAMYFTNLNNLWIWNNLIVNVPKFSLEKFKNLKTVFFSIKGRFPNPLSEESRKYLEDFQIKNPSIKVYYDRPI